ncbi:complex I NDUFA9 subunit family protein [Propionivibrio dicarboxylicus]|uniref:NADH dehydrogenase n=1 Tax=Propionivibrio dicarboxylicus TaxID=83767 RepID=A0A1G7W4B1_9RHOO|nr:complex I NDUFA9 subunit family protein [Propionivibrio dicarboxylicus]SDG66796.1 NADH dehydrogenase [Propionivibrio dicarboxylicus]
MGQKTVLLIGGSGFVGASVIECLAQRGVRVVAPTRRKPPRQAAPTLDWIETDVNADGVLASLMPGVDAVINLVGILHDRDGSAPFGRRFRAAHVDLPRAIAAAMRVAGVRRLIHVSALRAMDAAPSAYLRSKAAGEAVLRAAEGIDVTVFRPSVIFGAGDAFLNLFAQLLRVFPVLPLAGASARFQPVFVGDVARVLVDALDRPETVGQVYELGGPGVYTLGALVEYVAACRGVRRLIVPLPMPVAYLQAALLGCLPQPPMTIDNLRSMTLDNVCDGRHDYPDWRPAALEAVVPAYLS